MSTYSTLSRTGRRHYRLQSKLCRSSWDARMGRVSTSNESENPIVRARRFFCLRVPQYARAFVNEDARTMRAFPCACDLITSAIYRDSWNHVTSRFVCGRFKWNNSVVTKDVLLSKSVWHRWKKTPKRGLYDTFLWMYVWPFYEARVRKPVILFHIDL